MKKLLVFLLILAVAGGLFAQDAGTFTWTGAVRLGSDLDFIPDDPVLKSNGDYQYGDATVSYDKGALNLEVYVKGKYGSRYPALNPTPPDPVVNTNFTLTSSLFAEYGDGVNGETAIPYKLAAKIASPDDPGTRWIFSFDRVSVLYGWYTFLDNQLKVDVAYRGWDAAYWGSPEVVATNYDNLNEKSGIRIKFAPSAVTGLSAGVVIPGLVGALPAPAAPALPGLLETSFKNTVIAAKYDVAPLTAAFGLKLAPSEAEKAYVAVKYIIITDTLSAKADIEVLNLGGFGDKGLLEAGANAEYTALPLTAGLTLKVIPIVLGSADKTTQSIFTANPYVYYNIINNTLHARLPITFAKGINEAAEKLTTIEVTPGLYWNLKGDANNDDPARGILAKWNFKYDLDAGKAAASTVSLFFRWNF